MFLKISQNSLRQSLLFTKFAGLRPATLFKKRPWHRYFPVNFVKFLRALFYRTPLGDCFYKLVSPTHATALSVLSENKKISNFLCFLRSLLNCVPCVLKTCSRANVSCVLTCSRANVPSYLRAHVPTCFACLRAHVQTC